MSITTKAKISNRGRSLGVRVTLLVLVVLGFGTASRAWAGDVPVLQEPQDGATVYTHAGGNGDYEALPVTLRYTCPSSINQGYVDGWVFFHVKLATTVEGLDQAMEEYPDEHSNDVCATRLHLPPGTYFWRVEIQSVFNNNVLISSDVHSFNVERPAGLSPAAIQPADGAVLYTKTDANGNQTANVNFRFTCPRYTTSYGSFKSAFSYSVSVATSPEPGPDGFPASIYLVPAVWGVHPSNADETECEANGYLDHGRLPPGTYYWQVSAFDIDFPDGRNRSNIWSFTVKKPEPKPNPSGQLWMSFSQAKRYTKATIWTKYKRNATRVFCYRRTSRSFDCVARYRVRPQRRFEVGVFVWHTQAANGQIYWNYRINSKARL